MDRYVWRFRATNTAGNVIELEPIGHIDCHTTGERFYHQRDSRATVTFITSGIFTNEDMDIVGREISVVVKQTREPFIIANVLCTEVRNTKARDEPSTTKITVWFRSEVVS